MFIEDNSEWEEIPRLEAMTRLEALMTVDLVSVEFDIEEVPSALGTFVTITWNMLDVYDNQKPVLLSMKDPDRSKPVRWFVHKSLSIDSFEL